MRIGVNAFPLRAEGGGARYVFAGLLSSLLKLDSAHHYIIFVHLEALRIVYQVLKTHNDSLGAGPDPRVRVIQIADEGQIYAYRYEFDLLFGPLNNLNPRLYDRPSVAILHDIQEQYFPEYFSKSDLVGRQEVYPDICRSATILVAISEFCKKTFVEKFQVEPEKVRVIPNAPQAELVNCPGDGKWTRGTLPERFLFYPANCYRHKNHVMLLDVADLFRQQGEPISIVFSGFELPGGFPLRKEIASRGLSDLCHVFTDLPAAELRHLYRRAVAVVLPTKFEGFGMPAVEAAACGCPLVCSDLPAFHEILGNNAVYFDPGSVDGACTQIRRVLSDHALRENLIENGTLLARRFTWDESARLMLDTFNLARDRFAWDNHAPGSVRRPRIGVIVRLSDNGSRVGKTIESLLVTGYADLVIRCLVPPTVPDSVRQFLKSAGVQTVAADELSLSSSNGHPSTMAGPVALAPAHLDHYALLQEFVEQERLDLVGAIAEGGRFKPSAMDSVAWGYLHDPTKPVLLGEAMDWNGEQFVGTARMRLTGDGLWKMEGFLYPELLFINPAALADWPAGHARATGGGDEWRWDLLREARHCGRLLLLRRTIADTDRQTIPAQMNRQAARSGMYAYHDATNERNVKVRLLRRMEPVIKRAARILPLKWQDAGTRLWYHMAR